ncbi:unnamed protein product, partial [Laminaria digitata]
EFQINTLGSEQVDFPTVTALSNGGYFVVWSEAASLEPADLYGRFFDASGNEVGSRITLDIGDPTTGNAQFIHGSSLADVAELSDGNIAITYRNGAGPTVAKVIDQSGNTVVSEFSIGLGSLSGHQEAKSHESYANSEATSANITALENGGFVIVGANNPDVQTRVFENDGTPRSAKLVVNTSPGFISDDADVSALSGGGHVIVWRTIDFSNGPAEWNVHAKVYNDAGTPVSGDINVALDIDHSSLLNEGTTLTGSPDVAGLPNGGFVVVWTSGAIGTQISGQQFDASGNPVGSEFAVNSEGDFAGVPSIAATGDGGWVVSWTSFIPSDGGTFYNVFAQQFDPQGNKVGDEFLVNEYKGEFQGYQEVEVLQNGQLVAVWQSDAP